MGLEIERKFLVTNDDYKKEARSRIWIRQGFLTDDLKRAVRVRIVGDNAFITIKGKNVGAARHEFEYPVDKADAKIMIEEICIAPVLSKYRYLVDLDGLTWEVDEFKGENEGLVIAEVELPKLGHKLVLPVWAGREVTHDKRYYNASLVRSPYRKWKQEGL